MSSCTDTFCYNIGEKLISIKEEFERGCQNNECVDILLPKEKQVFAEYVSTEYLDRRTMELARCFVQNVLRTKRDKTIKQYAKIPRNALTGRLNPERNILIDISKCETMGVSAFASSARFMGSFGTIQRCNISNFNIESIKRLINDTNWRLSARFNSAQTDEIEKLLDVFHNYIVGIACGNPARTWSPNVMYTYGVYSSQCPQTQRKNFCTILEKIPSLPKQENLTSFLRAGKLTPDLFLSVLLQVSITLEIMQSQSGFVHYDLHTNNIILRPVYQQSGGGITWTYLVYGLQYVLKNIQFIATIIDFGYSSYDETLKRTGICSLKDKFVGMGKFQKYGSMDFMMAGYDMFVLLNNMRNMILSTLDPSDQKHFLIDPYGQENNISILSVIEYILKEIYQAPELYTKPKSQQKLMMTYRDYNVLLCKGAGITPLNMVEQLLKSSVFAKTFPKLPLTIEPRSSYVPTICKKKVPPFLTDLMPNWKSIINDRAFFEPPALLGLDEIPDTIDTLLSMIKNKQILYEFDYRPLMMPGGAISQEALDYYSKLVLNPQGYYYGYFQNTMLFYNTLMVFLNTYYYKYYIQQKDFMETFVANNDKLSILFKYVQQPTYVTKIAGIVRFGQTIINLKSAKEKNFCCVSTKETLGSMGQQKLQQQKQIYQIVPQSTSQCLQSKALQQRRKQTQQQQQQRKKAQSMSLNTPQVLRQQVKRQQVVVVPTQQVKRQQATPTPQVKRQQQATPNFQLLFGQQKKQQATPTTPQVKRQQATPNFQSLFGQKKQQTTTTTTPQVKKQQKTPGFLW